MNKQQLAHHILLQRYWILLFLLCVLVILFINYFISNNSSIYCLFTSGFQNSYLDANIWSISRNDINILMHNKYYILRTHRILDVPPWNWIQTLIQTVFKFLTSEALRSHFFKKMFLLIGKLFTDSTIILLLTE